MKSFKQYLRQTLYESDPQKYDDVGKKIDNETSEVPVWRGGIPPSEIVDDQVFETDEEIEKDEEQQAKKNDEFLSKQWVKRQTNGFKGDPSVAQNGIMFRVNRKRIWDRNEHIGINKLPDPSPLPPEGKYDSEPETWDNSASRSG